MTEIGVANNHGTGGLYLPIQILTVEQNLPLSLRPGEIKQSAAQKNVQEVQDLVKLSKLLHKKCSGSPTDSIRKTSRHSDSSCQTVLKIPKIHAGQLGLFLAFYSPLITAAHTFLSGVARRVLKLGLHRIQEHLRRLLDLDVRLLKASNVRNRVKITTQVLTCSASWILMYAC